jgi:hypothetical protein
MGCPQLHTKKLNYSTKGVKGFFVGFIKSDVKSYGYGFNGQEKCDEISGIGNHNTALFWEYDTRLGRRWNLDPKPNLSLSGYSCFENNPSILVDVLGDSSVCDNKCNILFLDPSVNNDEIKRKYKDLRVFRQDDETCNLILLGKFGKELNVNTVYKNLLDINFQFAQKYGYGVYAFYLLVRSKGDADYKNNTRTIFGIANKFDRKNKTTTLFRFGSNRFTAEEIGNHHYGFFGLAWRTPIFSEEYLLRAAGRAQIQAGTSKAEWQRTKSTTIFGVKVNYGMYLPPYGDDPHDQEMIQLGFNYFNAYHGRKCE